MCHKILVPLDGSKQAELAVPLVVELVRIYNAEITSLRVVKCLFEMYSRCHPNVLNKLTHILTTTWGSARGL